MPHRAGEYPALCWRVPRTRLASALHHVRTPLHRVGACSFHSGAQPDRVGVRSFHAIARPYRLGECNEWRFAAVLEGPGEYTRRVLLYNACSARYSLSPYFANQVKTAANRVLFHSHARFLPYSAPWAFASVLFGCSFVTGWPNPCPRDVFCGVAAASKILPAVASSRPPKPLPASLRPPSPFLRCCRRAPKLLPAVASPSPKVCFLTALLPCPMSQAQGPTFHLGNPAFPPYFMSESL